MGISNAIEKQKMISTKKKPRAKRPKPQRTPEQSSALLQAQQARAAAAREHKKTDLNPTAQGLLKQKRALEWIYKWGWSTSKIIEMVGQSERSGLAARLTRNGLLKSTKTESGGYGGGPAALFTLTELGLNRVEKNIESEADLLEYQLDPYRIDQDKIRHSELAQIATASQLKQELICDYLTERMGSAKSEKTVKQHDIVWVKENGIKVGIEIELSAKWSHKLDEFILSCILSIKENRVSEIFIVTDSKAIESRYSKAFTPGAEFGIWEKNTQGFKKMVGTNKVPNFIDGKVTCLLI